MRVNLRVPYAEKDEAKSLGARWDIARKTWYVVDVEDLAPFLVWIQPGELLKASKKSGQRVNRPRIDSKPGVSTPRTDFSLPDCGCMEMAPWEECKHSEPQIDPNELAHIRSI